MDEYLEWLGDLVGCTYEYLDLLGVLHSIDFKWSIANDDNRASDGLSLRRDFGVELDRPCTFLEMLVALSSRIENDLMMQMDHKDRTAKWFWMIMDNTGLSKFTSDEFDRGYLKATLRVSEIVEDIMDRNYMSDGDGGLFPLNRPTQDQTEVEIWYQMMAWIDENYPMSIDDDI